MHDKRFPLHCAERASVASDIRRMRQIFDRRAARFQEIDFLSREIARRMHERLDYIKLTPARVLDAGCGVGADLPLLSARFPAAVVTGLDLSHRMRVQAHRKAPYPFSGQSRLLEWIKKIKRFDARPQPVIQADFAMLPFTQGAFDLFWSNLALQWRAYPEAVFAEWQRVLKKGGLLMFSTLGPDSLREVRAAWCVAETGAPQPQCLSLIDMHDLGDMLVRSGFEMPVMDMEMLTLTYRTPEALLNDIPRWGADLFERALTELTSRSQYAALIAALEKQRRADGRIGLTFEVVYGHAWKAGAQVFPTTPEGYGIVRVEDIFKHAKSRREAAR